MAKSFGPFHHVVFVLSLSSALVGGCGSNHSHSSRTKIVHGQITASRDYPVVALLKKDSSDLWYSYCTGVMISPQHLLTAAHCSQGHDGIAYEPEQLRVQWGADEPELLGEKALKPISLQIHPDYNSGAMGKDADGLIKPGAANDIALWQLETGIQDGALQPVTLVDTNRAALLLQHKQSIFLLGFGQTSSWSSPWESHRLMSAATPYHPRLSWSVRKKEVIGGRIVTRTVTMEFPAYTETEFYAGDRGEPDTCKGDSGGPALIKGDNGSWELLGLTSRGDANCDRGGVYTLVPAFRNWIEASKH